MKSNIKILTLILVLTTSCMVLPRQTEAQHQNVSFQVFYDELSPYGQWIDYDSYGYVWIPDVDNDFAPYSTNGQWVMTDYGWAWDSDYNWGWAAFHYGRWSFNDSFGWYWVPGNEWGPAWVNWRQADGYYGWSPMESGITISMSFNNQYDNNYNHWFFVRDRDFDRANVNQYYVNRNDYDRIGRNSSIINNTYTDNTRHTTYVTGPSRNAIQTVTGRQITPLTIQESNRPGKGINNGRLQIYRPQIERNNVGKRPIPTRVIKQNEVKRRPARDASNPSQQVNPGNMQERPANRVIQENNSRQTIPQRNDNNQQNRTTPPSNERKVEPVEQQRRSAPVINNNQERRPNVITPKPVQQRDNIQQKNKPGQRNASSAKAASKVQRTQPQRVNPSNNSRPVIQRKSINQNVQKAQEKIPDKITNDK
jgi:hypothetical protein